MKRADQWGQFQGRSTGEGVSTQRGERGRLGQFFLWTYKLETHRQTGERPQVGAGEVGGGEHPQTGNKIRHQFGRDGP